MLCLLGIILALGATWPRRGSDPRLRLKALAAYLTAAREAVRSGTFSGRPDAPNLSKNVTGSADPPPDHQALAQVLDQARRDGVAVDLGLRALTTLVRQALTVEGAGEYLRRLLWGRCVLGAVIAGALTAAVPAGTLHLAPADAAASLGRTTPSGPAWRGREVAASGLAALAIVASQALLRILLPRGWLGPVGHAAPNAQAPTGAAHWLTAYLYGRSPRAPTSLSLPDLEPLVRREFQRGVSLLDDKRSLLVDWAEARFEQQREVLQRLEDALPLFELVGVGLPVALLLLSA